MRGLGNKFGILIILALVLVLVGGVVAVNAQEPSAVPFVTQEIGAVDAGYLETFPDGGILISVDEGTAVVPVEALEPSVNYGGLLQVLLSMGVALLGGASFAMIFTQMSRRDKDELERNYEALSPKWQDTILHTVAAAEKILEVANAAIRTAREVTDRLPNTDAASPSARMIPYEEFMKLKRELELLQTANDITGAMG